MLCVNYKYLYNKLNSARCFNKSLDCETLPFNYDSRGLGGNDDANWYLCGMLL